MAKNETIWKALDKYSAEDIKALPMFKKFQDAHPDFDEDDVTSFVRVRIGQLRKQQAKTKVKPHIEAIFAMIDTTKKQIIITTDGEWHEKGKKRSGLATPRKQRWKDSDWEALIGEPRTKDIDGETFTLKIEKATKASNTRKREFRLTLIEPDGCERVYPPKDDDAVEKPKGGKAKKGRYEYETWSELRTESELPSDPKVNLPSVFGLTCEGAS